MDEKKFFDGVRGTLFGGKMSAEQVGGIQTILTAWQKWGTGDRRHLAYVLATAYHETGRRMIPVREGQGRRKEWTDAQARNAVKLIFDKGVIKTNYALPEKNGLSYYGRGLVQLTWPGNYQVMGKLLGIDLYSNPDLALDPEVSARILIEGSLRGLSKKGDFTRYALEDFINDKTTDYVGARKVINGTDKAKEIGNYARRFDAALLAAGYGRVTTAPHTPIAQTLPATAPQGAVLIELVQNRLRDLGFPEVGIPNGDFGDKTVGALAGFQNHHSLPITGSLDQNTLELILDAATPKKQQVPERAEASGKTVAAVLPSAKFGSWLQKTGIGLALSMGVTGFADGTGSLDALTRGITGLRAVIAAVEGVPAWFWLGAVGGGIAFAGWMIFKDQKEKYRDGKALQ